MTYQFQIPMTWAVIELFDITVQARQLTSLIIYDMKQKYVMRYNKWKKKTEHSSQQQDLPILLIYFINVCGRVYINI